MRLIPFVGALEWFISGLRILPRWQRIPPRQPRISGEGCGTRGTRAWWQLGFGRCRSVPVISFALPVGSLLLEPLGAAQHPPESCCRLMVNPVEFAISPHPWRVNCKKISFSIKVTKQSARRLSPILFLNLFLIKVIGEKYSFNTCGSYRWKQYQFDK